jgi:hypothetical protein
MVSFFNWGCSDQVDSGIVVPGNNSLLSFDLSRGFDGT